jgi:hypothetical protein
MKYLVPLILAFALLIPVGAPATASGKIPTFSIISVVSDQSVTIETYNFPANDTFDVLMGEMGTKGVKGIKVATTFSGKGGSFRETYTIPAGLHGDYQIAIRLQSTTGSGYFAYNWFLNNTAGGQPGSKPDAGYKGYPTFSITGVARDQSVTIKTNNLPPNDTFDVLMGPVGTQGIKGTKVASLDSGSGGVQTHTYTIPASLKGLEKIAIRLQSSTGSGYFAYNWFYNNSSGSLPATPGPTATPGPSPTPQPGTVYDGYPTFSISSVTRDQTVTIKADNLPPGQTFDVLMGPMGKKGIQGTKVALFASGAGGSQSVTFDIPASLKGSYQIAIRLESNTGSGYFAYNWFYNNNAP